MSETRGDATRREGGRPARPGARVVYTLSEEETCELGRSFAARLGPNQVVLLEGDLGLGKTVFARGVAAGLGVPSEDVSSPSFALIHEHTGGRLPLYHIDLYRIGDPAELLTLGLEDYFRAGGVVLVEWGERLPGAWRRDALVVRFHDIGEGARRIELADPAAPGPGPRSDA